MSRTTGFFNPVLLIWCLSVFFTSVPLKAVSQSMTASTVTQYADEAEEQNSDDDDYEYVDEDEGEDEAPVPSEDHAQQAQQKNDLDRLIRSIEIVRRNPNKYITAASIYNHLPFHEGTVFDRFTTNRMIKKLYELDIFEQIEVRATVVDENQIDLHIIVDEEPELAEMIIRGNCVLTEKDIEEKLLTARLNSVSPRKVEMLKRKLLDAYRLKNYHLTAIDTTYEVKDGKAYVTFAIDEGPVSTIRRVFFKGNRCLSDKRLRQILNTQEDWILSFLNRDGSYDPEFIEKDKRNIESFYKMEGFFEAQVLDVSVQMNPEDQQFYATFTVEEGEQYTFGEIRAQTNELLTEKFLLSQLDAQPGEVYSSKKVWESMETLKKIWGSFGYVFVDVQPALVPNRETHAVDIMFESDLGDRVFARRINILGNTKTRDKVIRRKLLVQEGDLLTNNKLDGSRERVQGLSFFDTTEDGVQWKINRINEKEADLDLLVKEAKTGRVGLQAGYGGSPDNPNSASQSFSIAGSIFETNLFGLGMQLNLTGQWSKQEWTASGTYVDPYFLDKPILLESNVHYTKTNRATELTKVFAFEETSTGGSIGTGYLFQKRFADVLTRSSIGIESIHNSNQPRVADPTMVGGQAYQMILDMRFQPGSLFYLQTMLAQDLRNHVYHPSKGYQWMLTMRVGAPLPPFSFTSQTQVIENVGALNRNNLEIIESSFTNTATADANVGLDSGSATQTNSRKQGLSFFKLEFDASWYTPLIGDRWLIFGLHTHAGYVRAIDRFVIPYRELFHVGGAMTVRGWEWGQIGPTFLGDPIGATKAFYVNAELIFPIRPDFSIKGCVFYDGGSGWDTPPLNLTPSMQQLLRNNGFDYRQSIGLGIRMLQPQPIRIDIGFKLDPRKNRQDPSKNEKHMEVHISTYREF